MTLLEQDADTLDAGLATLVDEQKRSNGYLKGILASIATGACLLAADVLVRGFGH